MNSLAEVAETVGRLKGQVDELNRVAAPLNLPPLSQTEWYQLITQKLLPQLTDDSYLVAAVVGGTNIGKSVIFNHLCNDRASATSPLASGTKHPTCIVPPRLADSEQLQQIFSEFRLLCTSTAEDALQASEDDILFWKESAESPENLLLLDTPDIDSDAEVNWSRADKVRRAADVLIGVLTQQKYNDAAVKKFFRIAAEEGKAVVVVFNQVLLPEDEPYWPIWLETFCRETGVRPEYVYVAPHDRRAAESNQLPFFARPWPLPHAESTDADQPTQLDGQAALLADEYAAPRNLMQDLSRLRFEEIKLRTLHGALSALKEPQQGIPAYLSEIRRRAGVHGDAWARLTERLSEISVVWPTVPNRIVIEEMRDWWRRHRTGWEASVHGFYDTVGHGLMWPIRRLRETGRTPPTPWHQLYLDREWQTIQQQLIAVFDRLESLGNHGNPVLAPRLNALIGGRSREELLQHLQEEHRQCRVADDLHGLVEQQMLAFQRDRQDWFKLLKRADSVAAALRPAVTVALFATGFGPVGHTVMPLVTDTVLQGAVTVAGDVAAGTATAAVGDQALSAGASRGVHTLEAWFLMLHQLFVAGRQEWLLQQLQIHLWGTLLEDLQQAAHLPRSPHFQAVTETLATIP